MMTRISSSRNDRRNQLGINHFNSSTLTLSRLAKQWRSNNSIQRIDWPSMSPDLNPIENVWKLLKMNLAKKNLQTYKALVSAIKKEWKNFPKDLTINLVRSMENRISDVISNKGDFIMY